jgi:PAS domain S-box-containing protein
MTPAYVHLDGRKLASLALIPFALFLIVLFTILDIRIAADPPFLLTILNTVFIGIIPLVIAAIAFRSYRSGGSAGLFLLGSGMLIFGLGSIAAGWLIGLPGGANISVAIYNVCILLAAVLFLTGALFTFNRREMPETTGSPSKIAAAALGSIVFVAGFALLAIAGSIPPFFSPGSGPTVLRQVVLSNAIVILAIASILLFSGYRQKREDFFFWYSVSLAVIAVGLVAALFIPALGSPVNWISRVMQYAGAGFALAAIIVAGRVARDRGLPLEETLSRFFSNAEAGYRSLVETATDAIVVFDSEDRVLVWNRAAETMFGYSSREAIGSSFFALAIPEESAGVIKTNFRSNETPREEPGVRKPVEITVRRKDGSTFPAELTLSRHVAAGTEVSTCIIRDLTARLRAEAAIRESEERYRNLFSAMPSGVAVYEVRNNGDDPEGRDFIFRDMNPAGEKIDHVYREEIVGKSLYDFFPSAREIGLPAVFRRVYQTGVPEYFPVTLYTDDKISLWVTNYVWRLPSGELVALFDDVTERRRADEALRESEAEQTFILKLNDALRQLDDPIQIQATAARLLGERLGADRVFFSEIVIEGGIEVTVIKRDYHRPGVSAITGRFPFKEFSHTDYEDYRAGRTVCSHNVFTDGRDPAQSDAYRAVDVAAFIGVPLVKQGNLVSVLGVLQGQPRNWTPGEIKLVEHSVDRTWQAVQRARTEEALRESEERLRLAQEAGHVGIWDFDMRAGVVKWTPGLETIYGLEPGSVSNYDDFRALVHPGDIAMVEAVAARAVREHEPFEFEFRILRPGGETGWVFCRGSTVYGSDGQPVRQFGVNIDITGRRQAEEILRYHAGLLETVSDAVISTDTCLNILSWNKAAEQVYGWRSDEVIGKNGSEILITEFPEGTSREVITRDMFEKGEWHGELIQRTKTGNRITVDATSKRLVDKDGRVVGAVSVSRDITGRKRAEEKVRNLFDEVQREKDRLSSLINSISDEVWFADPEKNFTLANPAALREFALGSGEIDIEKFAASLEVYRPDGSTRPVEEAPPLRALKGEAVRNQEEMIRIPRNGEIRYRQVSANPVRDAAGTIIGSVSVVRDITGRKKAEEALRESEEKFRVLTQNLESAVALIDETGAFSIVNASFLRMFGIPEDADILNVNSQDWARWQVLDGNGSPLDVDQHPVRKAALTGRAVKNQLVALKTPACPDLKWLLVSAEPIPGANGGIHQIICTYYDITDRKNAEEALKEKNEDLNASYEEIALKEEELQQSIKEISLREAELRTALAEKEVLLAEIHHRVKNNLTAFISLLSLKGATTETPEGQALKVDLQNRARSMALIHETLYRTHQYSEVDMDAYLTPLVDQITSSYRSPQSIRTVVEAKGVALDLARATPAGLIVNELVTNSLKHAFPKDVIACRAGQEDPCTIRIRLTKENGVYQLSVCDNGIGMPAGFDPLKAKTLGLKLVTFLAKHQMRAKIEVNSENGTEFVFRFQE